MAASASGYHHAIIGILLKAANIFSGTQVRVIYAYMFKDYIVLLHGIIKRTDEVPREDIQKAIK